MSELDLRGKRVFIRCDLNVPIEDGRITDDTRIRASVPGIKARARAGRGGDGHLAPRPARPRASSSLRTRSRRSRSALAELLKAEVPLIKDWVDGVDVKPGQVVMLENCRVNKGEKKDDEALARKIAALCDVYVNDAFGTAHRAEATTHGVARFAKVACAGPLMAAELDALGKALANPEAAAGRDRRRLQGLDQAHHPRRAGEEGRQPDRRRRHRQHLPARRRQADRQVARRARPRRRGEAHHEEDRGAAADRRGGGEVAGRRQGQGEAGRPRWRPTR